MMLSIGLPSSINELRRLTISTAVLTPPLLLLIPNVSSVNIVVIERLMCSSFRIAMYWLTGSVYDRSLPHPETFARSRGSIAFVLSA